MAAVREELRAVDVPPEHLHEERSSFRRGADPQRTLSGGEHALPVRTGARPGPRGALQAAVVAAVVVGVWFLVFHVSPRPVWHHTFDLRVYRGAVRWWLDGRPLYGFVRPHTLKGVTYPPFAVLPLLPLALGTESTATVLLTAVSGALVVLTTWWLVAPVALRRGWPRGIALAVAVPVAVAMEPIRETLGWGQIDLVIAALVLTDVVALRRGRPWAGVGIGLATAIKVTPGLFLVYLAVTRRWRGGGGAARGRGRTPPGRAPGGGGPPAVGAVPCGVPGLVGFAVAPSPRYWTRRLGQTGGVGRPAEPN